MKIYDLLSTEYLGRKITDSKNEVVLAIAMDQNSDIIIVDDKGGRVAISRFLITEEWEMLDQIGWERASLEAPYKYLDVNGMIKEARETSTIIDELRYANSNYFVSEEIAASVKDFELINRHLLKFRDMNDTEGVKWNYNDSPKYFIYYNNVDKVLEISSTIVKRTIGTVYFSTKELAKQALESFSEEIIKLYA
jgi:hypothetical protein